MGLQLTGISKDKFVIQFDIVFTSLYAYVIVYILLASRITIPCFFMLHVSNCGLLLPNFWQMWCNLCSNTLTFKYVLLVGYYPKLYRVKKPSTFYAHAPRNEVMWEMWMYWIKNHKTFIKFLIKHTSTLVKTSLCFETLCVLLPVIDCVIVCFCMSNMWRHCLSATV